MLGIITTVTAYLLGSIPFGYLIVRWQRGIDVRNTGSGSMGATNVMRNLGPAGGLVTLILDASKGAGAVLLAERIATPSENNSIWVAAAVVAAILGHCFPVWLNFRGGKGLATGAGMFILLAPGPVGAGLLILLVVAGLTRYIALGSIVAVAAFPALLHFLNHPPAPIVFGAAVGAVIIITKHHANIRRMLVSTEKRLGEKTSGT